MDENEKSEKEEKLNEKLNDIKHIMHEHGLGCGNEIANIVREVHPNALTVVPLYRSCIAIEQTEEQKKEGVATIHAYGDPHWMGSDITLEALKSGDFYKKLLVSGDRQGPIVEYENEDKCKK